MPADVGNKLVCAKGGDVYCECAGCAAKAPEAAWGGDCWCGCVPEGQDVLPRIVTDGQNPCCGVANPSDAPSRSSLGCGGGSGSSGCGCDDSCKCGCGSGSGPSGPQLDGYLEIFRKGPPPADGEGGCGCGHNHGSSGPGSTPEAQDHLDEVQAFSVAPTLGVPGSQTTASQTQFQPGTGNLQLKLAPPPDGGYSISPVLTYNSRNAGNGSAFGSGWTTTFNRRVDVGGSGNPFVISGSGQVFNYSGSPFGGNHPPQAGSINALSSTAGFSSFTETQPDRTVFQYGSQASGR